MKIRVERPGLRTTVAQEMASAKSTMISPSEASTAKMAKYAAIASAFGTAADVGEAYVRAKDEAVVSDAQSEYRRVAAEEQRNLETAELEMDAEGNIIEQPGYRAMLAEENLRQTSEDLLRGMSSRQKQQFENWRKSFDVQAGDTMARTSEKRSNDVLTARGNRHIRLESAAGNFVGALSKVDEMEGLGLIDSTDAEVKRATLQADRMVDYGTRVMANPKASEADFHSAALDLLAGKYPDGSDMPVPFEDRYKVKTALLNEWERREDREAELRRQNKGRNFVSLYAQALLAADPTSGVSPGDVMTNVMSTYANDGISSGDRDMVLGMLNAPTLGIVNDLPGAEDKARDEFLRILLNEDDFDNAAVKFIGDLASNRGLTAGTQRKIIEEIQGDLQKTQTDPMTMNLRRSSYSAITGHEEGVLMDLDARLYGRYNDMILVGREFERDIMRKARDLGPFRLDELEGYYNERVGFYRAKAMNSELGKIGAAPAWPVDGVVDDEFRNQVAAQVGQYLANNADDPEALEDVMTVYNNIRRVTQVEILPAAMVEEQRRKQANSTQRRSGEE